MPFNQAHDYITCCRLYLRVLDALFPFDGHAANPVARPSGSASLTDCVACLTALLRWHRPTSPRETARLADFCAVHLPRHLREQQPAAHGPAERESQPLLSPIELHSSLGGGGSHGRSSHSVGVSSPNGRHPPDALSRVATVLPLLRTAAEASAAEPHELEQLLTVCDDAVLPRAFAGAAQLGQRDPQALMELTGLLSALLEGSLPAPLQRRFVLKTSSHCVRLVMLLHRLFSKPDGCSPPELSRLAAALLRARGQLTNVPVPAEPLSSLPVSLRACVTALEEASVRAETDAYSLVGPLEWLLLLLGLHLEGQTADNGDDGGEFIVPNEAHEAFDSLQHFIVALQEICLTLPPPTLRRVHAPPLLTSEHS